MGHSCVSKKVHVSTNADARWTLYHKLKKFLYKEEKKKDAIVRILRFAKIQFCGSFLKGSYLQTCHRTRLARKWTIFQHHDISIALVVIAAFQEICSWCQTHGFSSSSSLL